ncbi:ABC-type spermidine/putrescine transport system ATP-binding protein [Candidatus Phytoplasma luffae]|uniref:ABC-type spermidine/putrescine transport system ATP-binding protein n=1 Tax=Loofah witches'-broom phytoplasma TaxID=35773 RepID=A0A975FIT4_LOWBP|nr:ABC transporter ATP-binding protein [Candidatus Phytoplasma luffae]QTX03258.1 ABC-type spermidine/putrescine transport system ATP-binding protein [Candidatus Phytoplasma luffae]
MTTLIKLKNISKVIDNRIILNDIDLEIKENEFVTLLGPSGCGKTTILRIIGGFEDLSKGDIFFNNQNITNVPPHKRLINTVFQKYALFPHLNVYENIAFSLRIKDLNKKDNKEKKKLIEEREKELKKVTEEYIEKINKINSFKKSEKKSFFQSFKSLFIITNPVLKKIQKDFQKEKNQIKQKYAQKLLILQKNMLSPKQKEDFIRKKVLYYLKLVGLEGLEKRSIDKLSGGEQQRVAISRALINEPKVLLLDEPLAALDLKLRKEMQFELKKIQRLSGITFIFVTHDQEEALSISDKIVVINKGQIQQIGTPEDIYNEPENKFIAQFIGESNLISGYMKKDFLVCFDDKELECVDSGFKSNQKVDIVIRPEDIDITSLDKCLFEGVVEYILFKGVHWEVIVKTKYREYIIHTTDFVNKKTKVGISFNREDIHVMEIW